MHRMTEYFKNLEEKKLSTIVKNYWKYFLYFTNDLSVTLKIKFKNLLI